MDEKCYLFWGIILCLAAVSELRVIVPRALPKDGSSGNRELPPLLMNPLEKDKKLDLKPIIWGSPIMDGDFNVNEIDKRVNHPPGPIADYDYHRPNRGGDKMNDNLPGTKPERFPSSADDWPERKPNENDETDGSDGENFNKPFDEEHAYKPNDKDLGFDEDRPIHKHFDEPEIDTEEFEDNNDKDLEPKDKGKPDGEDEKYKPKDDEEKMDEERKVEEKHEPEDDEEKIDEERKEEKHEPEDDEERVDEERKEDDEERIDEERKEDEEERIDEERKEDDEERIDEERKEDDEERIDEERKEDDEERIDEERKEDDEERKEDDEERIDEERKEEGKHEPEDDEERINEERKEEERKEEENHEPENDDEKKYVPEGEPSANENEGEEIPKEVDKETVDSEDDESIHEAEEAELSSGGHIFDNPFFNLEQVKKYFSTLDKALVHVFRQTLDEARLLNGTYANTTEEEVDIEGKKYLITKSLIKGGDNHSSIYVESLSSKSKMNDSEVMEDFEIKNMTLV